MLDSIIPFEKYLMMTRNDSKNLTLPNFHLHNFSQSLFHKNQYLQNKSTIFNLRTETLRSTSDPIDDFTKREMLLYNTLDKIAPKYEEIENLLLHIPEPNKTQIRGNIISRALFADNPIAFINKELKNLRKSKIYNRMLDDISTSLGMDKQSTKEFLKMGLKEDTTSDS